jgi:RNA polymerase sporulation-specific sigma factor
MDQIPAKNSRTSTERDSHLWTRMAEGDEEAREEIIISNRPLVFWMARKFHVRPDVYPDIIQEGMVALLKAVDNFDPQRGIKFSTYAFYRIKGHMVNYIQRKEARSPLPVEIEDDLLSDPRGPELVESMIALGEGMERLPEREAQIISEVVLHGQKVKDVAKRRGMDISHVYRLKRKAVASLKEWMGLDNATKKV